MGWFRKPKTLNERRAACGSPIPVRGRRNMHGLPTSYDDIDVAARRDRNWKQFRKTKWKRPTDLFAGE